jgi:hypothetical protein
VPTGPPGPRLSDLATFTPNASTLLMNPGDKDHGAHVWRHEERRWSCPRSGLSGTPRAVQHDQGLGELDAEVAAGTVAPGSPTHRAASSSAH